MANLPVNMQTIKTLVTACFLIIVHLSCAQNATPWNNKKSAVVLTYDDALNVHLDKVVPALDSAGFKGTFYLIGSSTAFTRRIPEWRKAAASGHELGNHTLFHPCFGKRPGREWVPAEYDLNTYTLKRIKEEILTTNALLEATDGKKQRTLGCPCGDTRLGDSSIIKAVKNEFVASRDGTPDAFEANGFRNVTIQWMGPADNTGAQMIDAVKKAMESRALLIFVFHGVGGEHPLNVSLQAHSELLQFLKKNQQDIWVAPFIEVAQHMKRK
jgi:peptidoglycan/xylan/chitin deacetylase (PgdA/CDA1 family)